MAEPEPTPRATAPVSSRILRAGAVVLLAHLLFKVLGLVQTRLVGTFTDDVTRDLFSVAFDNILMMIYLLSEESLGPALLPVFMEEKNKGRAEEAWRFASTVMTVQTALLLATALAVGLWPEFFVRAFTQWDEPGVNPIYMELGPRYARYMILGLFGMSLGSATYMLLNAHKRFFLAALGDAALKLGIIGALLAAWALRGTLDRETALVTLSAGVVLGSVFKIGTHLIGLGGEACRLRPRLDVTSPAFRRFLWLIAPLLVGIVFAKVRDVFNNTWVMSGIREAGFVAANNWGRKVFLAVGWIVPYALSIAMLPFFCEMVDRNAKEELGAMVTRSSRLIFLMCAPLAGIVVALSLPLAQFLFQAGKFTLEDARHVAVANACYSLVLPFYAVEYVLMQAFFSNRRMVSVTAIGMIFSALAMGLAYAGLASARAFGWAPVTVLAAVALAFTVSRALKVVTLAGVTRRFLPVFPAGATLGFALRTALVAAGAGAAAFGVRRLYEGLVPVASAEGIWILLGAGGELALAGSLGAVVAAGLAWGLCREDARLVIAWGAERIRRRRNKGRNPDGD
jgi:murein biosynthesis integral membrane protein MurJ